MERIKQALDRALQERGAALERVDAQPAPAAPTVLAAGLSAGLAEALAEPAPQPRVQPPRPVAARQITYTETRTFQPSLEVLRRNRVLPGLDEPSAVGAYKILRTQVLQRMKERGWNALAVTSPGPGQGKTLTAVNLAVSLAREVNHTVLLVDLDLQRPSVHRCFGYLPDRGVSDIVLRDAPVAECLFNPGVERLVVLPGHEPVPNSSEVLSSPPTVRLVQELKTRYPTRMVIFDLPPVLSADDALAFAPYVDAALLVIDEGRTKRNEVTRAVEYLRTTELLGTVLNRSHEAEGLHYY